MAGFSAAWLELREPADTAARSPKLIPQLLAHLEATQHLTIADLGAGTGANLRWLAPRLAAEQHWHLLESDPDHVRGLPSRLVPWAASRGMRARPTASGIVLDDRHRITCHEVDLAPDPLPMRWLGHTRRVHLVTASALLDLVSADWLTRLAARCAQYSSAALLALTYDGRARLEPSHPLDAGVRAAVNRHQRGDKGFGPALGPDAVAFAAAAFQHHGYRVIQARSDWQLAANQAELSRQLLDGWRQAAIEVLACDAKAGLEHWRAWHARALQAGATRLHVGHVDLLALPRP